MDKSVFISNLKTLKELIFDEEKLVTYISLSKDLCIHVNEAKSLLNHAIKEIRETDPRTDINISYMISGLLNNNNACTTVCSETDIETVRQTLKIIFYEHIYCVRKGVQGADSAALAAINTFDDLSLCMGLIKANSCNKRTSDEIGKLKFSSNDAVVNALKTNSNDANKKQPIEKPKKTDNVLKKVEEKPIFTTKSKTPSPKKDASVTNNKINGSKNGTKPVKGISGFFNKMNSDSTKTKNTTKVKQENTDNKIDVKTEKMEIEEPCKTEAIPDKIKKEKPKNKPKATTSNDSSLKQIKKNAKVDKKRKRVLHVSDSESETDTTDPFAVDDNKLSMDCESEDEIPPTPAINTVKITSGIVNPKKRRKIVDKTYTDEEGYVLTRKEEVYESCSDNEVEVKASNKQEKENVEQVTQVKIESPQKTKGKGKKKISPPQKGKQQMLTSFFKKI